MRKLVLLAICGLLLGVNAIAQNYTGAFTHTTGTLSYNTTSPVLPVSVTVSPILTPGVTTAYCGAAPYYLAYDAAHKGGYRYDFSPAVTHVKFNITDFQGDDTIYIRVNNTGTPGAGPITPITLGMVSSLSTACDPNNYNPVISKGRLVNAVGSGTGTLTLEYGAAPGFINSIEIVHDRDSPTAGGIVYSAFAAIDSCKQPFNATADSPYCKTRQLKLHATNFPGSTFTWSTTATIPIPAADAGMSDPIIYNLQFLNSDGLYIVEAKRGVCTYKDTVNVVVAQLPNTPVMSYKGPKCAGENDTVIANAGGNTAIYFFHPDGRPGIRAITPPFFNDYEITNIQQNDVGVWKAIAVTPEGCATDTATIKVELNSLVKADFSFDLKLGCTADSVQFENLSLGNSNWAWDFDDGTKFGGNDPAIHASPLHIYNAQSTYKVKLIVSNARCTDSVTKNVVVNHPLLADFEMYNDDKREVLDDSICQGDTIWFKNLSVGTAGTTVFYNWDFKDRTPVSTTFEPKHGFILYGVYNVTLTVRDFLGCEKSISKVLVVDSLGSASFFTDTVLCTGQSVRFQGDYSTIGGTFAEWDFADGHTIQDQFQIEHAFEKPGVYEVKLNANYRVCKDTVYRQNIYVNAYPVVDLGPDTAICPNGEAIALKDLVNSQAVEPGYTWRWNTPTKDTTDNLMVHHPGIYSVTVDNKGCSTADTIVVKKNCYIDIPNVFVPNGDGVNDYFLPRQLLSRNVNKFSMTIYNRWGAVVFETNSINGRGWDGKMNDKEQPEGVYIYMIKVGFANGTNENYQGNVTLLR